jgi:hypothetical protein
MSNNRPLYDVAHISRCLQPEAIRDRRWLGSHPSEVGWPSIRCAQPSGYSEAHDHHHRAVHRQPMPDPSEVEPARPHRRASRPKHRLRAGAGQLGGGAHESLRKLGDSGAAVSQERGLSKGRHGHP